MKISSSNDPLELSGIILELEQIRLSHASIAKEIKLLEYINELKNAHRRLIKSKGEIHHV